MTKKIAVFFFSLACLAGVAASVSAASPFDIAFPIAELDGCANKDACRVYCDDSAHGVVCAEFAQKHGIGDQRTVQAARAVEQGGPGGCRSEQVCHAYCEDASHAAECVEFGVANGFMTRADADRALKPGPGGCRGKACQQYCADAAHQEECFEFGVANGFISKEEAKKIRDFKKEFEQGPGGCRSENECRAYCDDPAHINECVSFGEKHGLIDKEQARIVKKTHGLGPGGCKGNNECRAYCEDASHQNECIDFAVDNGFIKPEEAERARKFAGRTGPGGCTGDQCRDFCNTPGNEEQCLDFAEREGLIPEEELVRAKKFMTVARDGGPGGCRGAQCRDYCADALHREECFNFAKKQGLITKEEEKHFEAGAKIEEVVRTSGGPGGCKNDDACRTYCTDPSHGEECVAFASAHGGVSTEQAQKMLKDFTEHKAQANGDFKIGDQSRLRSSQQESEQRFEQFRQLEQQFRGSNGQGFGGGFSGEQGQANQNGGGNTGNGGQNIGSDARGLRRVGPGGCASPAECIKYCTEHREECFGAPDANQKNQEQNQNGGQCCPRSGDASAGVKLRTDLLREIRKDDLPQGFERLSPDERGRIFRENIEKQIRQSAKPSNDPRQRPPEGFSGQQGEPSGRQNPFPARPAELPQGGSPFNGIDRLPSDINQKPISNFPPDGSFRQFPADGGSFNQQPPSGFSEHPSPVDSGSFVKPPENSGSFNQPPPAGGGTFDSSRSNGSFSPPQSGTFSAPPPSGSQPPPAGGGSMPPSPPSGFAPITNFFAAALKGFGR